MSRPGRADRIPGDLLENRAGVGARRKAHQIEHAPGRQDDGTRWADVDRWITGAEGEEATEAELSRLPETWTVLHDVTVGARGANLDHVVIGAAGVFVINTKHRPNAEVVVGNAVRVNNYGTAYVAECQREATVASERLRDAVGHPVDVMPVLLFVGHATLTDKGGSRPVQVGPLDAIVDWLLSQPARVSEVEVERLAWAARHPETWLPPKGRTDARRRARQAAAQPESQRPQAKDEGRGAQERRPKTRGSTPARRPRQKSGGGVRALLSLALTALAVYALIQVAPRIGDFIGGAVVDSVAGVNDAKGEAMKKAASDVFAPAVRKQFPVITNGVPTPRLASIATYTCTTLANHEKQPNFGDMVTGHAGQRLRGATPAQVKMVLKTAALTTCPARSYLLDRVPPK